MYADMSRSDCLFSLKGGPSANMYQMKGIDQDLCDKCAAPSCVQPVICKNLDANPQKMTELYREVAAHPKVKKKHL